MPNLVFDFDGTIITCETLDILASLALRGNDRAQELRDEVAAITVLGMEGKIPFRESLTRRLALLTLTEDHVAEAVEVLKGCISLSFVANRSFWEQHHDQVFVISNGFKQVLDPVLSSVGFPAEHIFASELLFNSDGIVEGVAESVLLEEGGKGKQLAALNLGPNTIVVGDGYTDFLLKQVGGANYFLAYTEHVRREPTVENADAVVSNFDEVIAFAQRLA